MKNANEFRGKSTRELQDELDTLLREQFSLRMQKGTGQSAGSHLLRNVRRDIARIKTVINEKKRSGEAE